MRSQPEIEVSPGLGVAGDRYRTRAGHWSDPRWTDQELTLVESETAHELGLPVASLRRNLVTRGVRLNTLLGRVVRIGDVEVRFVRTCDPCQYLEQLLDRPGLRQQLDGRGGIRAAVLSAGTIHLGDAILAPEVTPVVVHDVSPSRWTSSPSFD